MSPPAMADGTSRTMTAPSPKASSASPDSASMDRRRTSVRLSPDQDQRLLAPARAGLPAAGPAFSLQPLIDKTLMRRMLINEHNAISGLRDDVGIMQLAARVAKWIVVDRRILGNRCRNRHVHGERALHVGKARISGGLSSVESSRPSLVQVRYRSTAAVRKGCTDGADDHRPHQGGIAEPTSALADDARSRPHGPAGS